VNSLRRQNGGEFSIPEAEAVDRLKHLIRENGKWVEPVPQAAAKVSSYARPALVGAAHRTVNY
jgi:hypothetical protein